MDNDLFEIRFSSELEMTKAAINNALFFLDRRLPKITPNLRNDIKLVFQELLVNSVIHGNKHDVNKKVYLRIEIINDTISAKIADEGIGFDHAGFLSKLDNMDMLIQDHGRGLKLVRFLTDSLTFNQLGNEIFFDKKVVYYE